MAAAGRAQSRIDESHRAAAAGEGSGRVEGSTPNPAPSRMSTTAEHASRSRLGKIRAWAMRRERRLAKEELQRAKDREVATEPEDIGEPLDADHLVDSLPDLG